MRPAAEAILELKSREFLLDRLARRSRRTATGCLEWTGQFDRRGYGLIGFQFPDGTTRSTPVHRIARLLDRGALDPDLTVDHLCANRPCIEPSHLDECSRGENSRRSPNTWNGKNSRKTHCPRGLALAAGNLVPSLLKRGSRSCLICIRAANARANAKRSEARRRNAAR